MTNKDEYISRVYVSEDVMGQKLLLNRFILHGVIQKIEKMQYFGKQYVYGFRYWCYVYLLATITYNMVYVLWFLRLMAANSDRCTYIACTQAFSLSR